MINRPSMVGVLGIIGCGGTQGAGFDLGIVCKAFSCDAASGFRFFFLCFLDGLCQNDFIPAPLSAFIGQANSCNALIQIGYDPDLNPRAKFGIDAADSSRKSCDSEII